jgi:hypothetical protein
VVEHGVKLEQAKQLIEKAVELEPKNAAFLDSLGWAFSIEQPARGLVWPQSGGERGRSGRYRATT